LMSTREPGRLVVTADGKKYHPLDSGGRSDMLSCHNALACVSVNLILSLIFKKLSLSLYNATALQSPSPSGGDGKFEPAMFLELKEPL
jgi:hypothetical protein